MSNARANIRAEVSADTTRFQGAMRRAQSAAQSAGKRIGGAMKGGTLAVARMGAAAAKAAAAAGAIGAALASAAMVKGLKMAADLGSRLSDVASRTGIAAGQVAVLERAFKDAGISGDKLAPTINKLQREIVNAANGSESSRAKFEALGLSIDELSAMSPERQFAAIQKSIAGIQDPARRAAAAMDIFGKSGGELLTLFSDPRAMENASRSIGAQADILDRNAQKFDRISDIVKGAGAKLQGFWVGMLDRVADPLLAALEKFEDLDLASMGQQAGDALKVAAGWALDMIDRAEEWGRTLMRWIDAGKVALAMAFSADFWKSVGLRIQAAFMDAANFAERAFRAVAGSLAAGFSAALNMLRDVLLEMMKPRFWKGMQKTLESVALAFAGKMLDVIASAIELMERIPGVKKLTGGIADRMKQTAEGMAGASSEAQDAAAAFLAPFAQSVSDGAKAVADASAKAFGDAMKEPGRFDSASVRDRAEKLIEPYTDAIADALAKPTSAPQLADRLRGLFEGAAQAMTDLPASPQRAPLGSDNVFARDRARLGIASGLSTGGLGATRRVGREKDEEAAKRQAELAKDANEHLVDIKTDLTRALSVA